VRGLFRVEEIVVDGEDRASFADLKLIIDGFRRRKQFGGIAQRDAR